MKKETEIEHLCRYRFARQFVAGKKVLDAACGSGYGSKILAENAAYVTGMDISAEAIAYAKKMYKQPNIQYLVGSVENLPFEDHSYDIIISYETIEHVNEEIQNSFIGEIARVLKDDGMLIISTPNKKQFTDERGGKHSEYHVKEFYVEEFRRFLGSQFDYVIFERQFYAKTACIVGGDGCQARIDDFNDEGMYIVAIASNVDIRGEVKNSFIMRYPDEYEKMNDFVQIFYSETMSFSEENSQLVEINNWDEAQEVCVKLDGIKCRYLRIDPINGRGIIRVVRIGMKLMNGTMIQINEYTSNADREENGVLYFYNRDPQILITLTDESVIDFVDFEFVIVRFVREQNGDDAIIQTLLEEINGLKGMNDSLVKENDDLKEMNDSLITENDDIEREKNRLQGQLMDIYNSKAWKIQQKAAGILKVLGKEK